MKRCCGDAEACRALFWPYVPERSKCELRAMLDVLKRGGSMADATVAGEEACRRYDAMLAKENERETSDNTSSLPASPLAPSHASPPRARETPPRVRAL